MDDLCESLQSIDVSALVGPGGTLADLADPGEYDSDDSHGSFLSAHDEHEGPRRRQTAAAVFPATWPRSPAQRALTWGRMLWRVLR